jgi:hypothetical protein
MRLFHEGVIREGVIHEGAPPAALQLVRRGVFGLWLVKLAVSPLQRLAALPSDFFQPIGLLRLIPDAAWRALLTVPGLVTLRVLTVAALALTLLDRGRWAAPLASAALLVLEQGLLRSVGYINHTEMVLLYAAIVLALAPLAERRSGPAAAPRADVPLVLITAILCLSYTFAGVSRLVLGLPQVFHPDTILMWTLIAAHQSTYYGWELGRHVLALPPALQIAMAIGLAAVTVLELLAPCCLFSRRFRRAFLVVMVPFHIVVLVTMNIFFWENLALFALVLRDSAPAPGRR